MGSIVVLDELTINKIAAGEVIERPASVIKEMVENSIDAGAKNISVEVKNGGISYIRVADDGKGIEREDLELSFERHATSKIRTADDLNEVKSMGFRGEALASIAAVSKVEMISKTANSETGNKIIVEGGDIKEITETGAPVGTTITVEELFFNTPVRYKFLKKDYTEAGYIEDVITRLALVHPEISFKFISSGKTIIQTSGDGNIKNVIYSIYGKTVATACLNVNYEFEGINISGVVGKPEIARSNRGNQIFFINKRYVRDRILSGATEKAFKGMIPIGKFGFLVLNLEMAPNLVDSNVHPAKLEVRFQEEQKVFKAVYLAIQDTLLKAELIANSEAQVSDSMEGDKMGEEQETKSSITGLFRKIAKNADTDNSNNLIESIYKSKNGGHDIDEVEGLEETNPKEERENLGVNSILAVAESKEIKNVPSAQPPITTNSNNVNITNEAAIKNTLNELMQMGKGLTAEQIREKIAKVAAQNAVNNNMASKSTNETEITQKENNITDNMPEWKKMLYEKRMQNSNTNLQGQNQDSGYNYQTTNQNSTLNNIKSTEEQKKKDIFEETFANFTLVPPKKTSVPQTEIKNPSGNIKVIGNEVQSNGISDRNENYETKVISTDEINKIAKESQTNVTPEEGQKPGDILLSILQDREQKEEIPSVPVGQFDDMYAQIFGSATSKEKTDVREEERSSANDIVVSNMNIFEEEEEFKGQIPYKLIGIAFRTYIILEIQNELYILDQHAAHERIMYEKVKQNYYSEDNKDSQLMLLPDVITLTHKEMDIARENMDKFRKAGFVLEEFGDNTIKLTGVPNICLELDTKELFLETLDEINTVARTAKQEIEERFIATIACKAAVKANMALTNEEVESLLEKLLQLPNPFTCPHGRPTAIKLSKNDIEKKFARRK